MVSLPEVFYNKLSKIEYVNFKQYVVQLLECLNAPKVTINRIEEKYQESPSGPIQYFDRALFLEAKDSNPALTLEDIISTSNKKTSLIFLISADQVYAQNTKTNEHARFHPKDIASQLVFLLPLILGPKESISRNETFNYAELITILRNEFVRNSANSVQKNYASYFVLDLIKAGIARHFSGNNTISADFQYAEKLGAGQRSRRYLEIIAPYQVQIGSSKSKFRECFSSLNSKSLELVKNVFKYDYEKIDFEILGSLIYRIIGNANALRSHVVSEENSLKIVRPLLIEPYLTKLTKLEQNSKDFDYAVENILSFTFLEPTNGTASILACAMNNIASYLSLSEKSQVHISKLKIQNFISINEDDLSAEISRIVIWFTYLSLTSRHLTVSLSSIDSAYKNVQVYKRHPLEMNWKVSSKGDIPDFIFGVPYFKGWHRMSESEKELFRDVAGSFNPSNLDFSAAWLIKAAKLISGTKSQACFGLTNSIVQGRQVEILWPKLFEIGIEIAIAYPSFKWLNDPKQNTGVSAVIIGIRSKGNYASKPTIRNNDQVIEVNKIGPYLVEGINTIVRSQSRRAPESQLPQMVKGNMPYDDGHLLLNFEEKESLISIDPSSRFFIKKIVGSDEFINSIPRYCIWIPDTELTRALKIDPIAKRIQAVRDFRLSSNDPAAKKLAERAHQFREFRSTLRQTLVIPSVSSENRRFIPIGFIGPETIVSNLSFAIYECPPWVLPVLSSSIHMIWANTTCGNLESRIRYSSQLCYNTFPLPHLSEEQIGTLTGLALDLISCREKFMEKSLGELYSKMPNELDKQHEIIDNYIDRIYGLKGNNTDHDRLRKLMEIYNN